MNNNTQKFNVLAIMPPKMVQGYPERVAKRHRVVGHNTTAPELQGHPHPSLLQQDHPGSPESTQGAPVPTQFTLSQVMLSTLTSKIATVVTCAL